MNIKRMSLVLLAAVYISVLFGQTEKVMEFIRNVKENKREKLAANVIYPLKREVPIPEIKNKPEFINRFDEIFDPYLINQIVNSDPENDWSQMGWRGIMLHDGVVWLDDDGNLTAVNYTSEKEKALQAELISNSKKALHASVSTFKQPVLKIKTTKFRIRIDEMENGVYRYASWPVNKKTTQKPDLVLLNGELILDGSGGNHFYRFENNGYVYECHVNVIGDGNTPPAALTVYKGKERILYQKAEMEE